MSSFKVINKTYIFNIIVLVSTIFYSCSSSKMILDFPNELVSQENTIHVKGTKGKGVVLIISL